MSVPDTKLRSHFLLILSSVLVVSCAATKLEPPKNHPTKSLCLQGYVSAQPQQLHKHVVYIPGLCVDIYEHKHGMPEKYQQANADIHEGKRYHRHGRFSPCMDRLWHENSKRKRKNLPFKKPIIQPKLLKMVQCPGKQKNRIKVTQMTGRFKALNEHGIYWRYLFVLIILSILTASCTSNSVDTSAPHKPIPRPPVKNKTHPELPHFATARKRASKHKHVYDFGRCKDVYEHNHPTFYDINESIRARMVKGKRLITFEGEEYHTHILSGSCHNRYIREQKAKRRLGK